MHSRIHFTLILVLFETVIAPFDLSLDDHFGRVYLASITLPSNPSLSKSEKLKKCHQLDNVKNKPLEDQVCERIVKFNDWASIRIETASEKVRKAYEMTHDWKKFKQPISPEEHMKQRDNVIKALDDAEKKELSELEGRIKRRLGEDSLLLTHRFMTIPQIRSA
ncbi:unnamed protein product [Cylicocyclus nassatus]|uniref:Uncharacterized protein n=1 Tax=Cylicocyclus nassatus TaxID=53992 RepID=A0AA36GQS6_CYLNA|nr:unnamed protein product [Cylicocyclus nassatus]